MTARVLLIDGDPATVETVQSALSQVDCTVRSVPPGHGALGAAVQEQPDLVIAGINDPTHDWSLCRELLEIVDLRLFLLIASRREAERVQGLQMGAVDCLSKASLSPLEFAARVRTILRRRLPDDVPDGQPGFYNDGDLTVDLGREEVWLGGRIVGMTPIEFSILHCLIEAAGTMLPYNRLLEQVWGAKVERSEATLRSHVHSLRQKLEPDPAQPQRILTCRGKGYILQRIAA